ncbi:O-Antigen ligase [Novipirellula galeiformis]|uniref:O-Antigen ligase n=1 Tax=Novipirellula galeiformis TaxID=2528004 RepID=A0A5C6CP86_9BACT|nr:O-antigen ligase family protein [Novipirellula galeiformis]TWU26208.1 O-Antigen ligase [Novipirellula galeiformis]
MTFLVVLFALAALVWLIPLIQTRRTLHIATLVLVTGTLFGPAFFSIDGPIQISLDRVLWVAMFAIVAIRWRCGDLTIPQPNRVDCLVAGITVWLLVSALMGASVPENQTPPLAKWLFFIAMPVGMYVVARVSEVKESDLRWAYHLLLGLGVYLAVTAIFEVSGVHGLVFPRYIVDPKDWEFLGRGRGPLLNPSGNAIVMCVALVVSILGVIRSTHRMRLFYAILSLVILAGVYSTLTRSAWMGAIAVVAVVALVYSPRWLRVLGLAAAILVGGAGVLGLKDQFLRMKRDKNLTSADAEKSIQLRPLLAVVAWEMFKDHPIKGHGFGQYFTHSGKYHSVRSYDMPLEDARPYAQHNVFLAILVDSGLIGLSMLIGVLVIVSSMAWNLARNQGHSVAIRNGGLIWLGTFAAYFCNGMFQDVTIIPMVNMYLFFAAGIVVTLYERGVETRRVEQPQLRPQVHAVSLAQ